jgi:hypothetical protein
MMTCCALVDQDAILGHVASRGDRFPRAATKNLAARHVNRRARSNICHHNNFSVPAKHRVPPLRRGGGRVLSVEQVPTCDKIARRANHSRTCQAFFDSDLQKIIDPDRKSPAYSAHPVPQEGTLATSLTLGQAAVDAWCRETSGADAYGEVVWS